VEKPAFEIAADPKLDLEASFASNTYQYGTSQGFKMVA